MTEIIGDAIGYCYECGQPIGHPNDAGPLTHLTINNADHTTGLAANAAEAAANVAGAKRTGVHHRGGRERIAPVSETVR